MNFALKVALAMTLSALGIQARASTVQTQTTSAWTVGKNGTILHTKDGGATWSVQTSGTKFNLLSVAFATPRTGWVVGDGGTILHTEDGGTTWTAQISNTNSSLYSVVFVSLKSGWAVGGDYYPNEKAIILHTEDGGRRWTPQTTNGAERLLSVTFATLKSGWTVGVDGTILHTEDGGVTWTPQSKRTTAALSSVAFPTSQLGWVTVAYGGEILHTEDAGATWTTQTSGSDAFLRSVTFVTPESGWIVGDGGTILHTEDAGNTWKTQIPNASGHGSLVCAAFATPRTGWAAGDKGAILHTEDGGYTWTPQETGTTTDLTSVTIFVLQQEKGVANGILGKVNRPVEPQEKQVATANQQWASSSMAIRQMVEKGNSARDAKNYSEAAQWFRKAAERGNPYSQNELGKLYQNGSGLDKDPEQAVTWYRKSAEQGDAEAERRLASMYWAGLGIDKDLQQSFRWYRKSAEQGDAIGELGLAEAFDQGWGVPVNYAEAAKWYRKAGDQGNVKAQLQLGAKYKLGLGVDQDYEQAAFWYKAAADRGENMAMLFLGDMYDQQLKDYDQAEYWYKKAEDNGLSIARDALARVGQEKAKSTVSNYSGNRLPDAQCGGQAPSLSSIEFKCELVPNGSAPATVLFSMRNSSGCKVVERGTGKITGTQGHMYTTPPGDLWHLTNGYSDDDSRKPFDWMLAPNTQEYPATCEIDNIEVCSATPPPDFPKGAYFEPFHQGKCTRVGTLGPTQLQQQQQSAGCVAVIDGYAHFSCCAGYGAAWNYPSIDEAIAKAHSEMDKKGVEYNDPRNSHTIFAGCDVVHGAIAAIPNPGTDVFYTLRFGQGGSRSEAESNALSACQTSPQSTIGDCLILESW